MWSLRWLFSHESDRSDDEREHAKVAEVDELLAKGEAVIAEKDAVAEESARNVAAIAAFRRADVSRRTPR